MDGDIPPVTNKKHPGLPFDVNHDESEQNALDAQVSLFPATDAGLTANESAILNEQRSAKSASEVTVKKEFAPLSLPSWQICSSSKETSHMPLELNQIDDTGKKNSGEVEQTISRTRELAVNLEAQLSFPDDSTPSVRPIGPPDRVQLLSSTQHHRGNPNFTDGGSCEQVNLTGRKGLGGAEATAPIEAQTSFLKTEPMVECSASAQAGSSASKTTLSLGPQTSIHTEDAARIDSCLPRLDSTIGVEPSVAMMDEVVDSTTPSNATFIETATFQAQKTKQKTSLDNVDNKKEDIIETGESRSANGAHQSSAKEEKIVNLFKSTEVPLVCKQEKEEDTMPLNENNLSTNNRANYDMMRSCTLGSESMAHPWEANRTPRPRKRLLSRERRALLHKYHDNQMKKLHIQFCKSLSYDYSSASDDVEPFRPSDIVIGSESCSDECYLPLNRIRHRRRKRAVALKTRLCGLVEPLRVYSTTLEKYGLESYGPNLDVPREDFNVKRQSRFIKKLNRKSVTQRKKRFASAAVHNGGNEDSCSPGTPGDIRDKDFFESSDTCEDEPFDLRKSLHQSRTANGCPNMPVVSNLSGACSISGNSEKSCTKQLKKFMGYNLVQPDKVNEQDVQTLFSYGKRKHVENENARPRKRPRVSFPNFNNLLSVLENDPEKLFADSDEKDTVMRDASPGIEIIDVDAIDETAEKLRASKATKKGNLSGKRAIDEGDFNKQTSSNKIPASSAIIHDYATEEDEDEQTITVFEKMKLDALKTFYKTSNSVREECYESSDSSVSSQVMESSENDSEKTPPDPLHIKPHFERYSSGFATKLLAKMGFKGRLGRDENGMVEPVMPQCVTYGAGLGCETLGKRYKQDLENLDDWISSLAPSSFILERDKKYRKLRRYKKEIKQSKSKGRGRKRQNGSINNETIHLDSEAPAQLPLDNGRRAVLIDFDSLFFRSHARRLRAFRSVISSSPEIPNACNVIGELLTSRGDTCDRDCVEALMATHNIEKTDATVEKFLERLDDAFEAGPKLEQDHRLMEKLIRSSSFLRIGVLHYGTERRMKRELALSRVASRLRPVACRTIQKTDALPYPESWRELFLLVGVHPSQSMLLLTDRGGNPVNSGVGVARGIGTRSYVRVETGDNDAPDVRVGEENSLGATFAASDMAFAKGISFQFCLKKQYQAKPFRRVLAINSNHGLWFSGVELFRPLKTVNVEAPILVKFDRDSEIMWVSPHDVNSLDMLDYLKFKHHGFPGLLDPEKL